MELPTWEDVQGTAPEGADFNQSQIEAALLRAAAYVTESGFTSELIYQDAISYMTLHLLTLTNKTGPGVSGPLLSAKLGNSRVQYAQPASVSSDIPDFFKATKFGVIVWGILEMHSGSIAPFASW